MKFTLKFIIILASIVFYGCKKNQIGGKATFKGVVMHNSKPISEATIYIKFNTSEFPGTDLKIYDDKVEANSKGEFSINFYKGSYYIYAVGTDLNVPYPYEVKGGMYINLTKKQNLEQNIMVSVQ